MTGLVKKVHHVAYRCKDAKQTVEWYGKHLGMKFILAIAEDAVPSTGEADPYMHVFLDAGGGNILAFFELPTRPEMGRDPNTPAWTQHLALEVGSMEELLAAKARLEADGIEVVGPTDHALVPVDLLLRSQRPPPGTGLQHPHAGNDEAARRSEVGHDQRVGGDEKGAAARALDARRQLQDLGPAMKLATLKRGGRDGTLVVVSRDLARCQTVADIAPTLQQALDDWEATAPQLAAVYEALNHGAARHAEPFDPRLCHSPCRAPTSGPTARPTSITSNWCARRAAPRCRPSSGPIR
jgi:catechol 2,3-dioxygenase-like lactoylglutathione lyase family enzyme